MDFKSMTLVPSITVSVCGRLHLAHTPCNFLIYYSNVHYLFDGVVIDFLLK